MKPFFTRRAPLAALAEVSMLALAASPALAQTSRGEQAAAAAAGVGDIVVTAQRRSENIQDVPITMQAIGGETLTALGVTDTRDLQTVVPGLVFGRNLFSGVPYIRGVGQNQGTMGMESPNAFYVDGVYMSASGATIFSLNNVERVEVLKGPQGTLFGRNAEGGVIHVITRRPSKDPHVEASLGYANFDAVDGSLYGTIGLGETLAVDIGGSYYNRADGWGRNLSTGRELFTQENWAIRNSWLWEPGAETDVRLTLFKAKSDDQQSVGVGIYPGALGFDGVSRYISRYEIYAPTINPNLHLEHELASLTISHDFGGARVTSITAYNSLDTSVLSNQQANRGSTGCARAGGGACTAVLFSPQQGQDTFTQEFQIASGEDSPFDWIAGLYYLSENFDSAAAVSLFAPPATTTPLPTTFFHQDTTSYSAFGQATIRLGAQFRLTLGTRWTKDKKEASGQRAAVIGTDEQSWSQWSYRAALDYKPSEDVLLFASFNRGFKSGVFNAGLVPNRLTSPPALPERLDAYEVGFKGDLLDKRLRFNASAFYYDYKNIQLRNVVGPGQQRLFNAPGRVKGIDLDIQARPVESLLLTAAASFLDGNYKTITNGTLTTVNPLGGNNTIFPSAALSGNTMIRSPKATYSLGALYTIPTASGNFDLNVKYYHSGSYFWEPDNRLKQSAYDLVDASVSWTSPSKTWTVEIWGKNLTDEVYFANGTEGNSDYYFPEAPRTYGARVRVRL